MDNIYNGIREEINKIGRKNRSLAEQYGQKFYLGGIVISLGCQAKGLTEWNIHLADQFSRYINCDWGNIPEEDMIKNNISVEHGYGIILASYTVDEEEIWISTQLGKETYTKIMLPCEW